MKPIVDFKLFIQKFPNTKRKSKNLAQKLLPLYPSKKLAEIVGFLLSDGHIDWYTTDGRPRTRKIVFYSNYKYECIEFLKRCKNVFKTDGKIEIYHSDAGYSDTYSYKAIIYNATIARILILTGAPPGDKTKTEFLVPKWIKNGDKEIKRAFLRALYNFDGSKPHVKKGRKNSFSMSYLLHKKKDRVSNGIEFINQIKNMFKEFDIQFGTLISFEPKNYKASQAIMISLGNQKSIINFYKEIGFLNARKQSRLKTTVETIARNGRIYYDTKLLEDMKRKSGSDMKAVNEINKYSINHYTKRQFEHMRRNESKVPFDMLFSIMKIMKSEKDVYKMPKYVKSAFEIYKNYCLRSPRMNSSNIPRAIKSGNCCGGVFIK